MSDKPKAPETSESHGPAPARRDETLLGIPNSPAPNQSGRWVESGAKATDVAISTPEAEEARSGWNSLAVEPAQSEKRKTPPPVSSVAKRLSRPAQARSSRRVATDQGIAAAADNTAAADRAAGISSVDEPEKPSSGPEVVLEDSAPPPTEGDTAQESLPGSEPPRAPDLDRSASPTAPRVEAPEFDSLLPEEPDGPTPLVDVSGPLEAAAVSLPEEPPTPAVPTFADAPAQPSTSVPPTPSNAPAPLPAQKNGSRPWLAALGGLAVVAIGWWALQANRDTAPQADTAQQMAIESPTTVATPSTEQGSEPTTEDATPQLAKDSVARSPAKPLEARLAEIESIQQERAPKSVRKLKRSVKKKKARALLRRGASEMKKKRWEQAALLYEKVLLYDATNKAAAYAVPRAYRRAERPERALQWSKQLTEVHSKKAAAWVSLGDSFKSAGDLEGARQAYAHALTKEPKSRLARRRIQSSSPDGEPDSK